MGKLKCIYVYSFYIKAHDFRTSPVYEDVIEFRKAAKITDDQAADAGEMVLDLSSEMNCAQLPQQLDTQESSDPPPDKANSELFAGAPEAGGRGAIAPLPFNILKTRGHRGQIVPFEICLTEIFLDLLYI